MTVVLGSDRGHGFHQHDKGVQRNFQRDVNWKSIAEIDGDDGEDLRLGIPKEMEHR